LAGAAVEGGFLVRNRVITALIGIPLILAGLFISKISWLIVISILAIAAGQEIKGLMLHKGISLWPEIVLGGTLVVILACFLELPAGIALPLLFFLGAFRLVVSFPGVSAADLLLSLGTVAYLGLFSYAILLRQAPQGETLVLAALAITWATDTGAYFAGRRFGKRRLLPKVSPNKTVAGSIGGAVLAAAAALIAAYFWGINWSYGLALGLAASLAGQLGDLFESALKRFAGVKDSGSILPGHGGVLDRFDSFLFAVPVVYFWALLVLNN